jgi:hypothetical protein
MKEREEEVREPRASEPGRYEAGASSAAPARETDSSMEAIDERAATTKTEPMARLQGDRQDTEPSTTGPKTSSPPQAEGRRDGSARIPDAKLGAYAGKWTEIQAGFVDDPRRTLEQADRLVAEVIDHLSKLFTDERSRLKSQWSRDGKADTEDLRVAMQRYREFFQTLVGR